MITVLTVCLLGDYTVISVSASDRMLPQSEDAGESYQNSMIFLGESTTAHLKSRGVLSGGVHTTQVWANESGTMMLSKKLPMQTIIYPKTGEKLTIEQALRAERPAYIVLSFGLNGIVGFAKDPAAYQSLYQGLIDCIQAASPGTAIILQTVYPVTAAQQESDWHFSASPKEINAMIEELNAVLPILASANTGVKVVDSASVLKDEAGQLRASYATEDGIHLRADAYRAILNYLRTHAYHLPMPLPITPDQWRYAQ